MPAPRVLCIGLDAFDKDLLLKWAGEGKLPTLRSLLQGNGASGLVSNPIGAIAGAVWPSFMTSLSPAGHGQYWWEQIQSGTYDVFNYYGPIKAAPFWSELVRQGKQVGIVDVPFMPLVPDSQGVQIKNWCPHDTGTFETQPADWRERILAEFDPNPLRFCDDIMRENGDDLGSLKARLMESTSRKVRLCQTLLSEQSFDLFLVVFGGSHCIGHHGWRLHDPSHPRHDARQREASGDPVEEVYRHLDRAVGKLLECAGPATDTILLASHGMGPRYHANNICDRILYGIEFGRLGACKASVARKVRSLFKRFRDNKVKTCKHQGRKFFQVPNCTAYGGLRLNLVGREPKGTVHPRQVAAVLEFVERELLKVTNPASGEKAVLSVHRAADLFDGARLNDLPDVFIEWNSSTPISQVYSPRFGLLANKDRELRTGEHKMHGMYLAQGPQIAAGHRQQEISIMDLGPTICSLLGVELSGVDGQAASFARSKARQLAA